MDKHFSCLIPILIMHVTGSHRIVIGQSYQNLSCQRWELGKYNQPTKAYRTALLWALSCAESTIRQRRERKRTSVGLHCGDSPGRAPLRVIFPEVATLIICSNFLINQIIKIFLEKSHRLTIEYFKGRKIWFS